YAEYVATGDNGTVEFGYDEDMGTGKNQRLLKQGGNLFLTSLAPVVQVVAKSPKEDGTNSVYQGTFFTLDEAAKEVDKIGVKVNGSYATDVTYTLLQDVNVTVDRTGANHVVTALNGTPAAKIPLPKAMRSLLINGQRQNYAIAFTGGTFALASNTMLQNVELVYLKKVPGGPVDGYTAQPYAVNLGTFTLDWWTQSKLPFDNTVGRISGNGALKVWPGISLSAQSVAVKDLTLQAQEVEQNGVRILNTSKLWAGTDITVSNLATFGGDTRLFAGGKITMNDVLLDLDPGEDQNTCWDATWTAASDKNPKTYQITVNGTIRMAEDDNTPTIFRKESEAPVVVGTWTDAGAGEADPTEAGTVLAAAPKASDAWFRPAAGKDAAGQAVAEDTFFVYKSGKNIIYDPGKKQDRVAGLVCYRNYVDADGIRIDDGGATIGTMTDFLTLTEALKEVDNLAATMEPGKDDHGDPIALNKGVKLPYARYDIMLYGDTDVKNAQGTAYAALTLPAKTSLLGIASEEKTALRFSGGVTLKSDLALTGDVNPVSMKSVTVNKVKTDVPTAANYTLGTYRLTIADTGRTYGIYEQDGVEYETVGNVTATAGKGALIVENSGGEESGGWTNPAKRLEMRIAGTLNSDVELVPNAMLSVGGAATVGTLTFKCASKGIYTTQQRPVFAVDKALTLGLVRSLGSDPEKDLGGMIWKKDLSTPVTVKGAKDSNRTIAVKRSYYDEEGQLKMAPPVLMRLGVGMTVPADTRVLTGTCLDPADWEFFAGNNLQGYDGPDGTYYDNYLYKNALYTGSPKAGAG
ncbi:MAG: hypothetical protein IKO80_07520, partial [Lachnospiraceae bacterium]|nr:hypothetical protein [Lachnospiraceae bacterium]